MYFSLSIASPNENNSKFFDGIQTLTGIELVSVSCKTKDLVIFNKSLLFKNAVVEWLMSLSLV